MKYTISYTSTHRPLLVTLALSALAATAGAQSGAPGGRCRACDSARAETIARYGPELARLQTRAALLRAEMAALGSRPSREADSALVVLMPQFRQVATRLVQLEAEMKRDAARRMMDAQTYRGLASLADSLQRRVQVRLIEPQDAPVGYMGVVVTGMSRDEDAWTKLYLEYPVVHSVDPGSPAARAGLQSGDTVLAYDGADVRKQPVRLRRLLRPGETVRVKVRRAGRVQEVPVVIARRHQPARVLVELAASEAGRPVAPRAPQPVAQPGPWGVRMPAPNAVAPAPPPSVGYVYVFETSPANQLIAGAELVRVTPDLGESFGVETGVLVLSVAPNTPAAQSGLRGGDVIVRVNGDEVVLPIALRRAIDRAQENVVDLEIVRKRKREKVRLTW